jgi:hypothetical protein
MNDSAFLRENVVDIDAAVVGISRIRWTYIERKSGEDEHLFTERARSCMEAHKFDILPIQNGDVCREYFQTNIWGNYSSIAHKLIGYRDIIPHQTHIRDVVYGFARENRRHFFLADENKIAGLITIGNLNSRQVKIYLFSLISEIEIMLGEFIRSQIDEKDLLPLIFEDEDELKVKKMNESYRRAVKNYTKDQKAEVEDHFVEYLGLWDLKNVVLAKSLHKVLSYEQEKFDKDLELIYALRNRVAHAVRSTVSNNHPHSWLWEVLDRIEEVAFVLQTVRLPTEKAHSCL